MNFRSKFTVRAFFKPISGTAFYDLGNVMTCAQTDERDSKTHKASQHGVRFVDDELADTLHPAYELTQSELEDYLMQCLFLASAGSLQSQEETVGAELSFEVVQDGIYFIGKTDVSNLVLSVDGDEMEDGVDFELEPKTGRIKILSTGGISSGDTVDLEFDYPDFDTTRHSTLEETCRPGTAVLFFYRPGQRVPQERHEFPANLNATAFQEHAGEFSTYKLKLTQFGSGEILQLTDRQPVLDPVQDDFDYAPGALPWNAITGGLGWDGPGIMLNRRITIYDDLDYPEGELAAADISGGTGWDGTAVFPE